MSSIGKNIRNLRKQKKMSQEHLAGLLQGRLYPIGRTVKASLILKHWKPLQAPLTRISSWFYMDAARKRIVLR